MGLPPAQRKNVLTSVYNDLTQKGEEDGLEPSRAYAELCLDYQGFSKESEWRADHICDGKNDYGFDCWDITDRIATVLQFKSVDFEGGIDETIKAQPNSISDIPRILSIIRSKDKIPGDVNQKARNFLTKFNSMISRISGNDPDIDTHSATLNIIFCSLASGFTGQTEEEFNKWKQEDLINIGNVKLKINIEPYFISDLIEGKWRENNTEWRDINGEKRDIADIYIKGNLIEEPKSLTFFSRAIDLVRMFEDFGYQIFEPNVRCEIQKSRVNEAIRASINTHRGRREFKHLNNGLTMICASFTKKGKPVEKLTVRQPGVINGLQTLKSIHDAYHELDETSRSDFEENCQVLVRLHDRNAVRDYRELVKSTNNQNPMLQRNLRANEGEQITYERLFADLGWFYERKEGAWAAFKSDSKLWGTLVGKKVSDFRKGSISKTVDNEQLAQCWLSFIGHSNEAVQRRTDIFGDPEIYEFIFLNVPTRHGCEYGSRLDLKEIMKDCLSISPEPKSLLCAFIARELARKLAPSAKKHREEAIARLDLEYEIREKQNEELNKDDEYLRGVILRAVSYIFPEVIGYCIYKVHGENFVKLGETLLNNGTFKRLHLEADFNQLKNEDELGAWELVPSDVLQTMWKLFGHLVDNLLASNWKQQWMLSPNRTRFNYRYSTRQLIFKEIDEIDKFLQKSQLTRDWAIGLNDAGGVFKYLRSHV